MNRLAPVFRILFSSTILFELDFESNAVGENRGHLFTPGNGARAPCLRDGPTAAQRLTGLVAGAEFHMHATAYRFEDVVHLRGIATDDVTQPGPAQGVANNHLGVCYPLQDTGGWQEAWIVRKRAPS